MDSQTTKTEKLMKLTVPTLLLQLLFVWTARPLRLKTDNAKLINTLLQLLFVWTARPLRLKTDNAKLINILLQLLFVWTARPLRLKTDNAKLINTLLQLLFVWTARPLRLKIHKANLINTLLQLICIHFYTISATLLIPFCSRKTKSATYKDTKTESPLSQETTTTPVQNRTHAM